MKCHEVDYKIIGDDMQIVEIELDPKETVIAEAGAMNYLDPSITFESKMGDGSKPETGFMDKMFSAGKRILTGESIFMTHFTNFGEGKKHVAFASPYPGKIIALNMSEIDNEIIFYDKTTKNSFENIKRSSFNSPKKLKYDKNIIVTQKDVSIWPIVIQKLEKLPLQLILR